MRWASSRARRIRRLGLALAALLVLGAVAAASGFAVGGSTDRAATRALVQVRTTALGRVLVDGRGRTLYLFEADKGKTSVCYGRCATVWPPLLTSGEPRAGVGARAELLGTTVRRNGKRQVTYRGHPLYSFVRDERAGQTLGQGIDGFGGKWYVLDRAGRKIEQRPTSGNGETTTTTTTTTTETTTDDGGGYGYGG